jgi:hypothetical protein
MLHAFSQKRFLAFVVITLFYLFWTGFSKIITLPDMLSALDEET